MCVRARVLPYRIKEMEKFTILQLTIKFFLTLWINIKIRTKQDILIFGYFKNISLIDKASRKKSVKR